jgi:hypothetical protein
MSNQITENYDCPDCFGKGCSACDETDKRVRRWEKRVDQPTTFVSSFTGLEMQLIHLSKECR